MSAGRRANETNGDPVAINLVQGSCCSTQCSSCINFAFLRTTEGLIKSTQIISGAACQKLLIGHGFVYATSLGSSYYGFLTTVSASVLTSLVLLLCYLTSQRTFQLVRPSLFEIVFNGVSSFLYLLSSCYFLFALYTFLYPIYKITSLFQVYPEMSVTYILGFVSGILHGYDSCELASLEYYGTVHQRLGEIQ